MLENMDNKLSYVADDVEGASVYAMMLAGRDVFFVKAHRVEPGMPIYIQAAGSGDWHKTASRAFLNDTQERVSATSMKEAVYGNLPWLMADLIAPKN
jgi:hypothetical protein